MCLSLGGITAAPLLYHRFWSLDYGLAAPFITIMIFFAVIGMCQNWFSKDS